MVTIRDIAREAGVSQGTVSNVLNGKGNVSSDKIRLVEETAAKLGYTVNRRAKILRKGVSNALAVLLPNMYDKRYTDFFSSFKHYAESCHYSASLFLSDDDAEMEKNQLTAIRSEGVAGLAAFTCQPDGSTELYTSAGFSPDELIFVERSAGSGFRYLGFDYAGAGAALAREALAQGYREVVLVTESLAYSCERQFFRSFCAALEDTVCRVRTVVTDRLHCNNTFLHLLNEGTVINAIFMTSYSLEQAYSNHQKTFILGR